MSTSKKKSGTCQIRVRYGETDQMGYCYYGNYAQFFEVGRVELLRNLGLDYKTVEKEGVMLPVLDYQVRYLKPAFYDDVLSITTQIDQIQGTRIDFSYQIHNETDQLIAKANTTLVFINKENMKPTQPPTIFHTLIEKE